MSVLAPPLTGDPLSTAVTLPPDRAIASLMRRIIAFVIDGIIVGLVAFVITIPFFETLSRLGPFGRVLGFLLALPYFAILNSRIGQGQTFGKRWMNIQVTDSDGKTISFGKSLVRYTVFAVPFYLNQIVLPTSRTPWIISSLISLTIFAVGGATLYLVLFNRRTRQGVHDLAAGSYVADSNKSGPLKKQPIWRAHWLILGSLLLVLTLGLSILSRKLSKWGPFPELLEDSRLVEEMEGVQSAGVQDLTWANWGSETRKKILVMNVFWTGRSANEEAFANEVAKLILQRDPNVQNHDLLRVVIIRGYDLGIAHAQVSRSFEHTPTEWKSRLFGSYSEESSTPSKL